MNDLNMQSIVEIIIGILLLYIAIKLLIFIWSKILIPGFKFVWKLIMSVAIVLVFITLYVMQEAILDNFSKPMQYLIIVILAMIAGINYLRKQETSSKRDDKYYEDE